MPLIGTAGHVDHGKSTLIQRLTGRDPDRWDEEKRRGLTIDLGFAWTTLPGGIEVSFVDVPGHERYLKNMLAGIEAIDVALFVVAADEGWMPQSEEHLAVLDLLDVQFGVVALTKTDTVDSELLELAQLEIVEELAGTTLEDAEIVPVSGKTGANVDTLIEALDDLVARARAPDHGRPRLWVDRSFTAPGSGTVVTGTLLDGSIGVDDPVVIYPRQLEARVRGIQSHEKTLERAGPGRRVALNLAGIDAGEIERGDMVGFAGHWELTDRVAVSLRPARYVDDVDRRGAYQVHVGSAVVGAKITGFAEGVAVIQLQRQLPVAVGDRFIVRDTGRKLVVGGGCVLDPAPGPVRSALASSKTIDLTMEPDDLAGELLALRGTDSKARLSRQTRGGVPSAMSKGDVVISDEAFARMAAQAVEIVGEEHREHPLRVGISIATLAERLGVDGEVADLIVDSSPDLDRDGPEVSLMGRQVEVPNEAEAQWERVRKRLSESLAVPTVDELRIDPELLHLKIRNGEAVRVRDFVWLPHQIDQIKRAIRQMTDGFTVAQFRDATELSRKYAVPLLEWADAEGLTVRRGDVRTPR